jgi:hypothetical protein
MQEMLESVNLACNERHVLVPLVAHRARWCRMLVTVQLLTVSPACCNASLRPLCIKASLTAEPIHNLMWTFLQGLIGNYVARAGRVLVGPVSAPCCSGPVTMSTGSHHEEIRKRNSTSNGNSSN